MDKKWGETELLNFDVMQQKKEIKLKKTFWREFKMC
jgi:hypothetical protein